MFHRSIPRAALLALLLSTTAAHAEVTVSDAWARATVPGQSGSGAFMTLQSSTGGKLLAARSPAAEHVEVHEMAMQDGVMKMREVKSVELPAGQAVQLSPGGHHIMLMGLKSQLKAGSQVPLTLTVEEGGKTRTLDVSATVRPLGAAANHGAHDHSGHGHKH
jgi:copper(I)-binding protein